jgi:hypothetical protein
MPDHPHTALEHVTNAADSINRWYIGAVAFAGICLWGRKKVRAVWNYWHFWATFPKKWPPFMDDFRAVKTTLAIVVEDVEGIKVSDSRRSTQIDRICGHMQDDFFHRHLPSFECDGNVNISLVSYALCLLCEVSTQDDISVTQWRNFLNPRLVDCCHGRFLKASADKMLTFRDDWELVGSSRKSRGTWKLVARFIGDPAIIPTTHYIVNLYPADDTAKAIAEKYGWIAIE